MGRRGPADVAAELEQARQAHRRGRWLEAVERFVGVDAVRPLDVDDLERLAEGLDLVGRGDDAVAVLQRVHAARVDAGDVGAALRDGDNEAAFATAGRAAVLGARCGDRDLVAIAAHLQGRAMVGEGPIPDGLALLDEAMLDISAGATSARVAAWIYCKTIQTCQQVYDLGRAREWTAALNAWCDTRPQLVGAYSGICRIHRSELLQSRGHGLIVTGGAFHQLAEIHRLHGEFAAAEQAYRQAGRHGWQVQPGIALLRLAQGDTTAATASIRRPLAESADRPLYRVPGRELTRSQLLPAYVEITVAGEDLSAANAGAVELVEIAERYRTPALHARASVARGAVHLAGDRPDRALPDLRHAHQRWHELGRPTRRHEHGSSSAGPVA